MGKEKNTPEVRIMGKILLLGLIGFGMYFLTVYENYTMHVEGIQEVVPSYEFGEHEEFVEGDATVYVVDGVEYKVWERTMYPIDIIMEKEDYVVEKVEKRENGNVETLFDRGNE